MSVTQDLHTCNAFCLEYPYIWNQVKATAFVGAAEGGVLWLFEVCPSVQVLSDFALLLCLASSLAPHH